MTQTPPPETPSAGASDTEQGRPAPQGTLLRARNGDVISYDETGLVMRLSDRVVADIARRIGVLPGTAAAAPAALDPELLGDIDAWNLRQQGEWHVFEANLPGEQGARQFRCLVEADSVEEEAHIVADAPGALLGILSIGGPRTVTSLRQMSRFPYHVTAPADDIGAVGMAGIEPAVIKSHLNGLRELTRDALLAEVLLADRQAHHRAMPLYMVRAETASAPSVAALAAGPAFDNLMTAAGSLAAAAERMAKPARVLCVRIDYGIEDVQSDATAFRDGILALMERITAGLAARGFHKPVFLMTFDSGTHAVSDHPGLRAQWELAWNHAGHDLLFSAPGYAFAQDGYGRPTAAAMQALAEMDAQAVTAMYEDRHWFCPVFLLAEREGAQAIRLRARAMADLVIDAADPLGAGPAAGFSLEGETGGARIIGVQRAAEDPQDLILTLDRPLPPVGAAVTLLYALGAAPRAAAGEGPVMPAARGAVRDSWTGPRIAGLELPLHRWALPCALPVN